MSLEECVKTEPEWNDECGVSEAAACAGLYEGHRVKDELVIGPELLQPRDVAYTLGLAPDESWLKICKQDATSDQLNMMTCEQPPTIESQSSQPPQLQRITLDKPFDYEPEVQSPTDEDKLRNKNNQKQGGEVKEKKTYICDTCSEQFSDRKSLIRHLRIHTKRKMYICDTCNKWFSDRKTFIMHIRIHTGLKRYKFAPDKSWVKICKQGPASYQPNMMTCEQSPTTESQRSQPPQLRDCFVKLERITLDKPFDYEPEVQSPTEEDKLRNKNNQNQGGEVKEKKTYICDTCSKQFSDRKSLIRHLRIHTKGKLYICDTCNKRFSDRKTFIIHIRIHTGLKPYACEICEKNFSRVKYLAKHKLIHEDRPFSCEICKKKFTMKDCLKRHKLVHTEGKRFSCEVCSKKLASQNSLDRHKLTHTGERPFSCGICEKQYRHQASLAKHMRMHTQETYECDQKMMSHQNSYNNKRQLKKSRKLNYKVKCDICKKHFFSWYLTAHKQTHTKPFQCEICDIKFGNKRSLLLHYSVHTGVKAFSCEMCGYQSTRADHLTRHRRKHTEEKPFSCNVCEKRFKDKGTVTLHMRIHTGEKPYGCGTCGKRFRQNSNFNKHKRSHDSEMNN